MLFNSIEFAIFLPVVFVLYWFCTGGNTRVQNVLLLIASYVFYGWWDWRFLSLIVFSSFVDYTVCLGLSKYEKPKYRKLLLLASLCVNIGFLGFFKYFNFFADSFVDAFTLFGRPIEARTLNVILPVGISFYTFQTLSHTIDVYRRRIGTTRDPVAVFAFVRFFPQLVAGPIERAGNLLPQFCRKRNFDYHKATDGLRQILWGLFKKMVIADKCAPHVNEIFTNYTDYSGSTLFLGVFLFALQIYGDFSGYSDIAIGTSRLFGFSLMRNFAFPYFSRDIAEFWRRWHISLSTWFRDYVYIPLGGSKGGSWMSMRNIFIIFAVSGFWHGANWTFIVWGLLNALYFLPLFLLNRNRTNLGQAAEGRMLPSAGEALQMAVTFFFTLIAWVFFRSPTVTDAFLYLKRMLSPSLFSSPEVAPAVTIGLIVFVMVVEWIQRDKQHALQIDGAGLPAAVRWAYYNVLILVILAFSGNQQEFIYFQF